jgi:thioredoxin 2
MDTIDYYVRCTHCSAKNKLPLTRLGRRPSCGKCKQELFPESSPISSGTVIIPCKQCQTNNKVPLKKLAAQPRCGKCKTLLDLDVNTQSTPFILSDQNFAETVLRSPLPFLVNFHSPNCGPCKLLNPIINKMAKDYEGRLKLGTFNVDTNPHISTLYRIGGTPTLLLFQGGKERGRLEGYQSSGAVAQWVRPYAW